MGGDGILRWSLTFVERIDVINVDRPAVSRALSTLSDEIDGSVRLGV